MCCSEEYIARLTQSCWIKTKSLNQDKYSNYLSPCMPDCDVVIVLNGEVLQLCHFTLAFLNSKVFQSQACRETNFVISSQPDYSQARTWFAILQQQSIEAIKGVKRMCLQSVSLNANYAARRLVLRLGYLHQEGLNIHFCCNAERSDKKCRTFRQKMPNVPTKNQNTILAWILGQSASSTLEHRIEVFPSQCNLEGHI